MDAVDFLTAIQGLTSGQQAPGNKLATIDPAYTIGTVNDPTLPKVTFDGESTMSTKRYPIVDGYLPAPSQRVLMVPIGRTYVVAGAVSSANRRNSPPRVKVYRHVDQTGIPTGTVGAIIFDSNATTVFEQPSANLFHSHVTNPSRFTIPTGYGGLYSFKWAITYGAASGGQRSADIYKNGSFFSAGTNVWPSTANACCVSGTDDIEVADGDFYELAHYQASGVPLPAVAGIGLTYMSMIYRGPVG
jgi:hypothetical protein